MPDIKLAAGKAYLVMQPERRADLQELSRSLECAGFAVDLDITEYVPGRRGISFNQPEDVAIYVAGMVSAGLISAIVADLYQATRDWAMRRFQHKVEQKPEGLHRPETFRIYGPDNEVLKQWGVDDQGEHEELT